MGRAVVLLARPVWQSAVLRGRKDGVHRSELGSDGKVRNMHRRDFLLESSLATLGLSTLVLPGNAYGMQNPARSRDAFLESLIARWEDGIPTWLKESKMP